MFGPGGHIGSGGDASVPSTSRLIDLLFGPQGAFGYLREFSAPIAIYNEGSVVVSAVAGHHRDAPALIYRIDHAGKSMTPPTIGEIADDSRAKRLVLAHPSPTLENARAAVEASIAQRSKGRSASPATAFVSFPERRERRDAEPPAKTGDFRAP